MYTFKDTTYMYTVHVKLHVSYKNMCWLKFLAFFQKNWMQNIRYGEAKAHWEILAKTF